MAAFVRLGLHLTEIAAAKAYDRVAIKKWGPDEAANKVNFPLEQYNLAELDAMDMSELVTMVRGGRSQSLDCINERSSVVIIAHLRVTWIPTSPPPPPPFPQQDLRSLSTEVSRMPAHAADLMPHDKRSSIRTCHDSYRARPCFTGNYTVTGHWKRRCPLPQEGISALKMVKSKAHPCVQ